MRASSSQVAYQVGFWTIAIGEPRFSGPTEKKYVEQVDKLMGRLGLARFVGRPYLSLFAITLETYKESLTRGRNHASGGRPALILDLSKVETGTLFVFNGDVQKTSPTLPRLREFTSSLATSSKSEISCPRNIQTLLAERTMKSVHHPGIGKETSITEQVTEFERTRRPAGAPFVVVA